MSKLMWFILCLQDRVSMHLFEFGPTIEPYASDHCFLSDDPKILARNCWSNNIPAMIGYTDFEGLLLLKSNRPILFKAI